LNSLKDEQLKMHRLKTNGQRKNVWSIFSILNHKHVEDLTVDLSDLKKSKITNGKTVKQPSRYLNQLSLSCTTQHQQQAAHKKALTP
jgi:hypothetical protein